MLILRQALALALFGTLFPASPPPPSFERKLPKDLKPLHALNRLTFGPTPEARQSIQKLGVEKWIDLQLHPSRIPEIPALEARLALYKSLTMPNRELERTYPAPNVLNTMLRTGSMDRVQDPLLQARLERFAARRKQQEDAKGEGDKRSMGESRPEILAGLLSAEQLRTLRSGSAEQRASLYRSMTPVDRDNLFGALPPPLRNEVLIGPDVALRRDALAALTPVQVLYHDLAEAKLLRAVQSNRQLEELMVDFWFNHFNVFFDKGFDRVLVTSYERDAIRPHVFGKFQDLLQATARHPAMLFYLDNWNSVAPVADNGRRPRPAGRRAAGLNENYARELLELHTLGVDGGYTQKDVTEVARCFTGWSIERIGEDAAFRFFEARHDKGEKTVLGHRIPAGRGMEDGMEVLDILANHPSTARFISTRIAQRFVADKPPAALITRMSKAFTKTHGDIRATMKAMLSAPEFWSEGAYRSKMKMPLEMVASALRATGASIDSTVWLNQQLQALGEPLYKKVEPTGYYPFSEEWTNSAALLARMNFGLDLAQNRSRGVKVDLAQVLGQRSTPEEIARAILGAAPSPETLAALKNEKNPTPARLAGLVLGGPEFQRR